MRRTLLLIIGLLAALATVFRVGLTGAGRRKTEAGTVDWYDPGRGFGYIHPDSGERPVFVHRNALHRWQRPWFRSGARVKFRAIEGGSRAFVRWVRRAR